MRRLLGAVHDLGYQLQSLSAAPDGRTYIAPVHRCRTSRRFRALKRCFDVVVALICAVVASPILCVICAALMCSGGGIIFAHERIGLGGRRFRCLKFRTMYRDASTRLEQLLARDPLAREEWARDFKLRNDPRVTRLGAFLRRTSLDELPQLWNVLAGDMCLVGPRPIVDKELVRYGRYARYYLSAKPGMTGLWQVSGRSNTSYRRRVALDCAYIRGQCLWLDVRILAKTVPVIIGRRSGAC